MRLEELIKFLPDQGKIFLCGSRATLADAYAFGKLRKDLIENLGIDRAKGFLIRYGWSCGYQMAMSLKEQFSWDSHLEWTYSGPIMHRLTGFVSTQPNNEDFDPETGIWLRNAVWRNSVEAEQHILHVGLHHEPVCWMLTGFASGYNSAYLGRTVIFKEIKCMGKGDEYCTNIGKTVEDWGDEILPELAYYQESKISVELAETYRRITIQNNILERTVAVHERLTECILNGRGVDNISKNLSELMKCHVLVDDRHFAPISVYIDEKLPGADLPEDLFLISNSYKLKRDKYFFRKQKRPFELNLEYANKLIYRLICPILVGSRLLGYVSLFRLHSAFSEMDKIGLEHAATVIALELIKQKEIAQVENRIKGDFIDDLLSGDFDKVSSIVNRARALDYDITVPHRVLMISVVNFPHMVRPFKQDEKRIMDFKKSFLSAKKAVEIGINLKRFGQVISLEQLGAHAVLFNAANIQELYDFASQQLGVLLEYDQKYNTQYILTLEELLNQRCNVSSTANVMNLSISGLKYRINNIENLTGKDLKDSQTCFNLQLALMILRLAEK